MSINYFRNSPRLIIPGLLIILYLTACTAKPHIRAILYHGNSGIEFNSEDILYSTNFFTELILDAGFLNSSKTCLMTDMRNNTDEHIKTELIMKLIQTNLQKENACTFIDVDFSEVNSIDKAVERGKALSVNIVFAGEISNKRVKKSGEEVTSYYMIVKAIEPRSRKILWSDYLIIAKVVRKTTFR